MPQRRMKTCTLLGILFVCIAVMSSAISGSLCPDAATELRDETALLQTTRDLNHREGANAFQRGLHIRRVDTSRRKAGATVEDVDDQAEPNLDTQVNATLENALFHIGDIVKGLQAQVQPNAIKLLDGRLAVAEEALLNFTAQYKHAYQQAAAAHQEVLNAKAADKNASAAMQAQFGKRMDAEEVYRLGLAKWGLNITGTNQMIKVAKAKLAKQKKAYTEMKDKLKAQETELLDKEMLALKKSQEDLLKAKLDRNADKKKLFAEKFANKQLSRKLQKWESLAKEKQSRLANLSAPAGYDGMKLLSDANKKIEPCIENHQWAKDLIDGFDKQVEAYDLILKKATEEGKPLINGGFLPIETPDFPH